MHTCSFLFLVAARTYVLVVFECPAVSCLCAVRSLASLTSSAVHHRCQSPLLSLTPFYSLVNLCSHSDIREALVPRRRMEEEVSARDQTISELRASLAQAENDAAGRRKIINDLREKNRALEAAG